MNSGLKLVLITLPLAAIGAGVLAYMVATSPPPAQLELAERTRAVRVITARIQPLAPEVTGFGLVQPAHSFEAIAQVGGVVEYVNPDLVKGEVLPAGAVLVRLSQVDFKLAIAQANANIRATNARLAELAVSETNQQAALRIEQETLALKAASLERTEALFTGGTVSQSALDTARTAHLAQRQKVLSIESGLALLPTQRDVQREQIAVYQANLETATLNLARTELTLPFDARVASVVVEVGQYLSAGKTSAMLDGVATAEIEAQIPVAAMRNFLLSARPKDMTIATDPTLMTKVLRGLNLSAEVHMSLGQDVVRWAARVDRISDVIDQKTGTLGVILQVDTAYSGALPGNRPPLTKGMFVQAVLHAPAVEGIVLPRSALRAGQVSVAGTDNRLLQIPLTPFLVQDEFVLITQGLEPGSAVIVSDPSPIIPGMLLAPTIDTRLMAHIAAQSPTGQTQ